MTAARTIALFKNDIAATIADAERKMLIVHNGNEVAARESVDFRLREVWGITLDQWDAR